MYEILPETEGRSLEDIEMHFSNNSLKLTDRNIPKSSAKMNKINDPKDCETNIDIEQSGKKSIKPISDMIQTNENAIKGGCDNKGFTMNSDR